MASHCFPLSFDAELGTAHAPRRLKVHSGITIAAYARARLCPPPDPQTFGLEVGRRHQSWPRTSLTDRPIRTRHTEGRSATTTPATARQAVTPTSWRTLLPDGRSSLPEPFGGDSRCLFTPRQTAPDNRRTFPLNGRTSVLPPLKYLDANVQVSGEDWINPLAAIRGDDCVRSFARTTSFTRGPEQPLGAGRPNTPPGASRRRRRRTLLQRSGATEQEAITDGCLEL